MRTSVRTLGDWASEHGWLSHVLLVVAGSTLTALAAQVEIRIPGSPVPITLQTLAVFVVAAALGARRAMAAMLLYLAEGAAGLPVFAGGAAGPAHLLGPTGGYLAGFVVAAGIIGGLAQRGWDRSPLRAFTAILAGNVAIFACGLAQLAGFVPHDQVLSLGLMPFVPGSLLKMVAAALLLPGAWRLASQLAPTDPPR